MEPVQVVCACNADYIMPLCTMVASLAEHFDPERDLVIHIISNDATAEHREQVRQSIRLAGADPGRVQLHWLSIDSALVEDIHRREERFSPDVYVRLFAPSLLPESCERVVYLDCDLVVLADISKLYDAAGDNPAVLHAVHDLAVPLVSSESGVFDYQARGIPPDTRYFNSGVMVINLKKWRERDLTPPMLSYARANGSQIHWVDQGVLNAFLHHDWVPLDARWNQQTNILYKERWTNNGYSIEEWKRVKNDPLIVHFSGPQKPWGARRRHFPRRIYFYQYLQKTVFRNSLPRYPYLESAMGTRAYYRLWKVVMTFYHLLWLRTSTQKI